MRLMIKVDSENVLVTTEVETETELGIETGTENDSIQKCRKNLQLNR